MRIGPRNLISDVPGLIVGNAEDGVLRSGCTVVTAERSFVAGVSVMGGAPGTRETDLLAPERLVQEVDALVLSGGSAFGLDACSGVADGLRAMGRGFPVGDQRVPIVPGAILFDLLNGGDKTWSRNPYYDLGRAALANAAAAFELGTAGAGYGATTERWKGGLGSASVVLDSGVTVGALVAVNALGSVTVGAGRQFWAAPWEMGAEFGGLGVATQGAATDDPLPAKRMGEATTIAVVACDARLSQAQATRMAVAAQDGIARAIVPSHTLLDGDLVFAAATGRVEVDPVIGAYQVGHAAAVCLARAIARGVFEARAMPGDFQKAWVDGTD
jgi:L-aminopeptidase/D-esterase-like protein